MAEKERRRPPRAVRAILPLLVLGTIVFLVYRYATRREDYTGGDITTTGTIEAVHVQLAFKVAGRLAEVPVTEGLKLESGALVGRLESQDFQVQAHTAAAALEQARAAEAQASAALALARAGRSKAASDLERTRSLMRDAATTPQAMDAAKSAAEASDAQVQAAEAQGQAAQAQEHQAESALEQASLQLSYAELRAPEGGVVAEKIHRPGEMVMVGAPIVTLAQEDTVKVHAAVDETRVGAVRPGDRVQVKVYSFDRQTFPGTVSDIQPSGDFATRKDWGAQRRDIRTFTVTADIPNPLHLLKDGMTAEVVIQVSPEVRKLVGKDR